MRRLLIVVFVLSGGVASAQAPPSVTAMLAAARAEFVAATKALSESDVYQRVQRLQTIVKGLEALDAAEKAKAETGSK